MKWIVKDNETGELVRFNCDTNRWQKALKVYIAHNAPSLSADELEYAADNFDGEMWPENAIVDKEM